MKGLDVDAAMTFLAFVEERHRIWEQRQQGLPQPWTADPVLATRKFTNVFRVLDPGSQFVFDIEADTAWDTLARLFFYRYTNLPATWDHVKSVLGRYPLEEDIGPELERIIKDYRDAGNKVFSGAYIIPPNGTGDKVTQVVELTKRFMTDCTEDFLAATTQADRFKVLERNQGVGKFLAMQILTDWGYTTEDREDEFVVLGPGALKGASALAPGAKPMDVLMWAVEAIRSSPNCPTVRDRKPSWMDVQNCFCEFSKYVRGPVATTYQPAHPGMQPKPTLPRWW